MSTTDERPSQSRRTKGPRPPDSHPAWCRHSECDTWDYPEGNSETFHVRTLINERGENVWDRVFVAAYLYEAHDAAGVLVETSSNVQVEAEGLSVEEAARFGAAVTAAVELLR